MTVFTTSQTSVRDFVFEVAKGNIPGHDAVGIVARNPSIGTSFADLWGPNVAHVRATANETWELVSSSANDTDGGAGANAVLVQYQDEDYAVQEAVVLLSGVTPVSVGSDCFRPMSMTVSSVGSTGYNEGAITLRETTTNSAQGEIPFSDVGFCVAQDGHYTVPAGKVAYGIDVIPFMPYNVSGLIRSVLQTEDGPRYIGAELPFYQSGVPIPINSPFALPEKTDIDFQAKVNTGTASITLTATLMLVDQDITGVAPFMSPMVF